MKLFFIITPNSITKYNSITTEYLCNNIKRLPFFTDGAPGKEQILLYPDDIGIEESVISLVENRLASEFKVRMEKLPEGLILNDAASRSKPLAVCFIVLPNKLEALLEKLSKQVIELGGTEAGQEFMLAPLQYKEKIIPGQIIFLDSSREKKSVRCISEYDFVDGFMIEGQFKEDAVRTGRSALSMYFETKDAVKEMGGEVKKHLTSGLKKFQKGLGQFIENIDK